MGHTPDFTPCQDHWQTIHLEKWLGVIRRRTYQAASEDSMWAYERVSNLWTDIEPGSYSSDEGSSDEGNKDQEKPDGQ